MKLSPTSKIKYIECSGYFRGMFIAHVYASGLGREVGKVLTLFFTVLGNSFIALSTNYWHPHSFLNKFFLLSHAPIEY